MSVRSAVRVVTYTQTDTHTHTHDVKTITPVADAGCKDSLRYNSTAKYCYILLTC